MIFVAFVSGLEMHKEAEDDYARLSSLLQEFTSIPNIDKAWLFSCKSPLLPSLKNSELFNYTKGRKTEITHKVKIR